MVTVQLKPLYPSRFLKRLTNRLPTATCRQQTYVSGFTLIELLIVVAIITILAVIAIPNFLSAQIRAKVSRMKADMVTIGTALETYNVDYGSYPRQGPEGTCIITEDGLPELSTPISYIRAMPIDIFHVENGTVCPISYGMCRSGMTYWYVWSFGPDLTDQYATLLYDPTNGTVSYGDLKYTTAKDILTTAPQ